MKKKVRHVKILARCGMLRHAAACFKTPTNSSQNLALRRAAACCGMLLPLVLACSCGLCMFAACLYLWHAYSCCMPAIVACMCLWLTCAFFLHLVRLATVITSSNLSIASFVAVHMSLRHATRGPA